jgi:membrane fusion protein
MTATSDNAERHADGADHPRALFRPEVAERNWEILASRGLLPHPPRLTGLVLLVLVGAFAVGVAFLVRGTLPRVEFAAGYLEPTGGVTRVRAPRQGIVGGVHVKDGQLVRRGDSLVTLQSGQTTESGTTAEAEIAAHLQSQRRDIEAQIAHEDEWRQREERRLAVASDELAQGIDLLDRTMETQRERLRLAQDRAERIRTLAGRGTMSVDELERREMAALDLRFAVQTSEREAASKRAQLATARIAIEHLPAVASGRLRSLREALANVDQRLIELDARRAVVVRAPVSGRIAAVTAFEGAGVDNASLIATIVPDGSELRARLFVPTRSIGNVHVGQSVAIRYEAFPYQKYGTFTGRIEEVSSSVLLPQEVDRISPMKLAEPAYVLDIALQRQAVALGGERQAALRPDMLLTATIEIDRRPLLAWIGESVFGVTQP